MPTFSCLSQSSLELHTIDGKNNLQVLHINCAILLLLSNFLCLKTISRTGLRKERKNNQERKEMWERVLEYQKQPRSKSLKEACGLLNEEEEILSNESKGKRK